MSPSMSIPAFARNARNDKGGVQLTATSAYQSATMLLRQTTEVCYVDGLTAMNRANSSRVDGLFGCSRDVTSSKLV